MSSLSHRNGHMRTQLQQSMNYLTCNCTTETKCDVINYTELQNIFLVLQIFNHESTSLSLFLSLSLSLSLSVSVSLLYNIPVRRCCASSSAFRFRPRLQQTIRTLMLLSSPAAENQNIYTAVVLACNRKSVL